MSVNSLDVAQEKTQHKTRSNLVANDEEIMVAMLRERYFEHANAICKPVHPRDTFYTRVVKRAFDFTIALIACIILLPFNLIFAICTYFDVGRPLLYKQARCGKDGKPFTMVKFRNMNEKKDENGQLLPPGERVTKFGYFMRKFSFDELLNFWHVLKGEMSLIGPRPLPTFFEERMNGRHKMRHAVRPGLECPRVIVPEGENLCQYHVQFENDVWYAENVSFLTDVKMALALIKMVFGMKQRGKRASGKIAMYFVGYDENGYALDMYWAGVRHKKEFEQYKQQLTGETIA